MWLDVSIARYLIQGLFPCIISSIFLIVFIAIDHTFSFRILNRFMAAVISAIILCTADSLDYYIIQTDGNITLRYILCAICYTARICTVGFTATITLRHQSKRNKIIYITMILNAIISFASIKTGIYFSLEKSSVWHSGPLFFMLYVFTFFYGAIILHSAVKKFYYNPGESVTILICFVSIIIANCMEIFCGLKMILSTTFIITIDFYFLCLNVQLYRHDSMTDTLNRRSFYMDLNRFSNKKITIISMDLNNLKQINDTKGHAAGDEAICFCSNQMKESFARKGLVYRTGGDEFMAIFKEKNSYAIDVCIRNLKNSLSKTEYRIAVGKSVYNPGDNIEKTISRADKEMYENKRLMKKEGNR